MRRATFFLLALSLVLAILVIPGPAHAAAPSSGPAATAQASPADAGVGGGFFARILDWLADFATVPADDGGKPVAPAPEGAGSEGDILPVADPNG